MNLLIKTFTYYIITITIIINNWIRQIIIYIVTTILFYSILLINNNGSSALGVHRKGQLMLRGRRTGTVEGRWRWEGKCASGDVEGHAEFRMLTESQGTWL